MILCHLISTAFVGIMVGGSVEVVGHCLSMCPEGEIVERENQRLVHPLEAYTPPQNATPDSRNSAYSLLSRKADRRRMVKKYRRPAAGCTVAVEEPHLLRPFPILLKTTTYLLSVFDDESYTLRLRYEFVLDRLRAVRQDAVVQRLRHVHTCQLLATVLPFYFKSKYKCEVECCGTYDWRLHQDQLEETLSRLDDAVQRCSIGEVMHGPITDKLVICLYSASIPSTYVHMLQCRPTSGHSNDQPLWKRCMRVVEAVRSNNFYVFFNLFPSLPVELRYCALVHVAVMRQKALQSLAVACRGCHIPASLLMRWLRFDSDDDLYKCCDDMNLNVDGHKIVMPKAGSKSDCKLKLRDPHWTRCILTNCD